MRMIFDGAIRFIIFLFESLNIASMSRGNVTRDAFTRSGGWPSDKKWYIYLAKLGLCPPPLLPPPKNPPLIHQCIV